MFAHTKAQGLEGVVAKRRDSLYYPGKRTADWVKIKNLQDEDFVVCGYLLKDNHMVSVVLGQYDAGRLVYQGHVTFGVRGEHFGRIQAVPKRDGPPFDGPVPKGNESAVWLEPALVCTVSYMERTKSGGMRQPVLKGLREDKAPAECKIK